MPKLLINTECNKRTCENCRYKEPHSDWSRFPTSCKCKIFNENLKVKVNKFTFYRLEKCLQAEKDYIELLMEG